MRKLRSEQEFAPSQADYPVYVFPQTAPENAFKRAVDEWRSNEVVI